MPSLNYMPCFAEHVVAGLSPLPITLQPKRTTIRRPGRARPGQTLYHFTGLRTAKCQRLGQSLCLAVVPLLLATQDGPFRLGQEWLSQEDSEALAHLDTAGLWGLNELRAFFAQRYLVPVLLELIVW